MEVILDVLRGNSFSIEVGPFDTVLDVKEKVQNLHRIPISHQIFVFNGRLLQDDLHVSRSEIYRGSRIDVLIAVADASNLNPMPMPHDYDRFGIFGMPEFSSSNGNEFEEPLPHMTELSPPSMPPMRLTVKVKVLKLQDRIPIVMELDDTVLKLKEKIVARVQGVPVERIVLQSHSARVEFLDHQVMQDCCAVSENNEMDVFLKPSLPVARGRSAPGKRKLNLKVVPMHTNMKIEIEVKALDKVSMLRQKLEQLHQAFPFRLPEHGAYFFIHNQSQRVMNEAESFKRQQIRHGDTIQTFDRFVTEATQ